MARRRIFVEISGGCFQHVTGVPRGYELELIDWDNLLGDDADTAREWITLGPRTRTFIRQQYPEDYNEVMKRIGFRSKD